MVWLLPLVFLGGAVGQTPPWEQLRTDHPRLFVNSAILPAVRARALGPKRDHSEKLKAWVDEEAVPNRAADHSVGYLTGATAFVYLVTEDPAYRDKTKALLSRFIDYLAECDANSKVVNWYSYSRINAIVAYDWLFNELTPEERERFGRGLLTHVNNAQVYIKARNISGASSGFYGTTNLVWYMGLALHGEGIADDAARDMIALGYKRYIDVLKFRSDAADDDGGAASITVGYSVADYPYAEYAFFHTMRSAFGMEIACDWPKLAAFTNWVLWNIIAGDPYPFEFGAGDAHHLNNRMYMWHMYDHLLHVRHFYDDCAPRAAKLAHVTQGKLAASERQHMLKPRYPWFPFLMVGLDDAADPPDVRRLLPPAWHFPAMGQIFMRSGAGANDTYCLFTAGGMNKGHRHFDQNNFVIYKNGHLALDTGTRPYPGAHLSHYYCRTVAHNGVLIRMPGEQMPGYWGTATEEEGDPPLPNDGGMNQPVGAVVQAYETNDHYTYVASDATACYHPDKAKLVLRQFAFVMPEYFVICDRVVSSDGAYPKAWLLHTAEEPQVDGDVFQASYNRGTLFCRTLQPVGATLEKIGGAGKQFFSDGRNWPLPPKGHQKRHDDHPLLGQWRVEVRPAVAATDDLFLHLIQVGDREALAEMTPSKPIGGNGRVGVQFTAGETQVTVLFDRQGAPGGEIQIKGPNVSVNRELTSNVQPQQF